MFSGLPTGKGKRKEAVEGLDDEDAPPDSRTDYWKHKGDNLKVDTGSKSILTVKYLRHSGYNAAFGHLSASHGKHIWKIHIIKKTTKMCIGVSSSIDTINTNFHRQKSYPNYGYNWDGSKISHKTKYQDYGIPIKSGQIITVILDLDKRCISFMNDHHNLGPAFKDVEVGDTISYRIAISIVDKDDKVQMIGYMLLNDEESESEHMDIHNKNGVHGVHDIEEMKMAEVMSPEPEEVYDLNINEIEKWNHKMVKQWIKEKVDKQPSELNGKDFLELLNQLQNENGLKKEHEALKMEYDKQANLMQSLQHKNNKLNKKNSKMEKKVNTANDEKDRVLLLYQVKEEEVEIAQKENERLRTQLLKLQKSLSMT